MSAVAVPPSKMCSRCHRSQPIDQFRRIHFQFDKRHADCNQCHNLENRVRKQTRDRQVIVAALDDIRRRRSTDSIATALDALVLSFGSHSQFANAAVQAIENGPPKLRAKFFASLLECCLVAERQQLERDAVQGTPDPCADPSAMLERLASQYQLIPALRDMYQAGRFTLDDLEPAGE